MSNIIEQLGQFLQHKDEKVVCQAAELCKGATSDPATCTQMLPILKEILQVTSSSDEVTSKHALVALINITSHCAEAIDKLIGLNGVTRIMDSVISYDAANAHEKLMLLTNLTTQPSGLLQILDLADKELKGQRLLRLAIRFAQPIDYTAIPKAKPLHGLNVITESGDDYEYAAMVLMNATLRSEGREIFFSKPDFFMPSLLDAVSGDNPIRKQGIIGVIRNLCFDHSKHEYLLNKVHILPAIIRPLISQNIEENNEEAAKLLHIAFPTMKFGDTEPMAVNRRNLLETLLLLTQSEVGKSVLIQHNVVFVMRELDEWETDEENKELGMRVSAVLLPKDEEEKKVEEVDGEDVD